MTKQLPKLKCLNALDLKLLAMAAMLAERFKKSPERLYSEIMRVLMSSEPEDEAEK